MLVWLLAQSASTDVAVRQHDLVERAHTTEQRGGTVFRLMSVAEISSILRSPGGLTGPTNDDFTDSLGTEPSKTQPRPTPPMATPDSRIVRATFVSNEDDVPQPILLVDFDEGCVTDDAPGLRPVFESTLASACDAIHGSGHGGGCPPIGNFSADGTDHLFSTYGTGAMPVDECDVCNPCSPWYKVFRSFCSVPTGDAGIGQERIMFAPFDIEVPVPNNYYAIRFDSADGLRTPDRAEYFWAKQSGLGPDAGVRGVNYQDLRFVLSAGGTRFSTITEIPLRFLDTSGSGSTGGMGDMSLATKLLLIDGQTWKITQYFKTTFKTGSVTRGLGTGHVSLEPGLLAQYKWSDTRYWFGELRYWFPVGADPTHSGNVLRYSLGTSKLWYETDVFAAMRTLEFVGTSVLSGAKTLSDGSTVVNVDGEHSMAVLPGLRFVLGPAGDLGLFELGVQAGLATNHEGFYRSLGRVELRFSY